MSPKIIIKDNLKKWELMVGPGKGREVTEVAQQTTRQQLQVLFILDKPQSLISHKYTGQHLYIHFLT